MSPLFPIALVRGETVEEALKNIREAIELYFEPVEDDLVPLMAEAVVVEEIEL